VALADADRAKAAIAQCEWHLNWYATHSRADWFLYRTFQIAIVALSGSTPVLILFTSLPKPVQAIPAAVATVVAAIADEHHLPSENLLQPDAVRRLCWSPPEEPSAESVRGELVRYAARPWQIELTAVPVAGALRRLQDKGEV